MFDSPLVLPVLAILLLLAVPAVWMLCEVALDLPPVGLVLAAACYAAIRVMGPHSGVALVDSTLVLLGLTGAALVLSSGAGTWRWMWRPRLRSYLPRARVVVRLRRTFPA
ncbi:MAG: hypothetical protein SFX73_09565 [Kofleriaceae bacterium]|nr:hypothetical protein [Kofleriaceae bacterium]